MQAAATSEAIKRATNAAAAAVVGAFALLFLVLATLAVTFVGVLITAGALLGRLAPRRARTNGPLLLEARRTPEGWVAEVAPPRA